MSKEFKVGLIAVVSGVILYWGFNFLKGTDFFSPTNKYYAIYENVNGLNKSNPVIVNGLTVGRVSAIKLRQGGENKVLVELNIDQDIVLGFGTLATLSNTDFLGSKGIVLTIGDLNSPLVPGDTLIPVVDKGIDEIIENATPMANNLNTTITRVNEILIGLKGSGENVNSTISDLHKTIIGVNGIIAANQRDVSRIIMSSSVMINNLNQKIDQIAPLLVKTNGVLDSLNNLEINRTLAGVDTVLYNLNATILALNNSQGSFGKLVNEDSLYNNLNTLLLDLDKMVIHMDQYPKDFFGPLGRKHKKLEGGK
jgi:phospholipid/cholesterol/gamma-HCH transport system substrate-binding protein